MNVLICYGLVLVILAGFYFKGHRFGFLRTAFSMLAIVISILLLSTINPYVHSALEGIGVPAKISSTVSEKMMTQVPEMLSGGSELSGEQQKEWMESVHIPQWVQKAVYNGEMKGAEIVVENVSTYLADFVTNVLSYFLSFLVVFVLLRVITAFLGIVNHIPIIGGLNRTLGGWLGLAQGLVVLWLLSMFVTLFAATEWGSSVIAIIESSAPLAWIYHTLIMLVS